MSRQADMIPHILIVDDQVANLQVMRRVLSDLPAKCHYVQSGLEALSLLVRHDFALAILDVQMPQMDGFELAELMNNNADTDQVPIIFVTAISKEEAFVEKGYFVGAVDYLFKPFKPELLLAKIKIFLRLHKQKLIANKLLAQQSFILDEINDGWWEWELGSASFFYSDKFKKILGYADHELANKLSTWQDLVNQEDLIHSNQQLEAHLKQGEPYQVTLRFRHREGHAIWMLCRGVCVQSQEGRITKMIGTFTDITPIKTLEYRLIESNQELEQFAYITSHDLRAPLRGIESLINWIEEDATTPFDGTIQTHFDKLKRRVQRMDNLINGILSYSRVSEGGNEKTAIDVNLLLTNVVDLLHVPANCELTMQSDFPVIYANDVQLKQVFSNLIGNAIKYHDKDQMKIHIGYVDNANEHLFWVSDNGPGIDPIYFDQIFQLFKTLQSRDKVESTGVGLTIVKKIIEVNGGRIWLESSIHEGARFYFTWPK